MLGSILLLDPDGRHLRHGAAPSLPASYCEAIDGAEIGPCAGSCGTAAYQAAPVFVSDIASDPLWADFREIALAHGLRACWSTPIFGPAGKVIGTFAIYHRTPRSPTPHEVESIRLITEHVAQAILLSRSAFAEYQVPAPATLRFVGDDNARSESADRFQNFATKLERYAEMVASDKFAAALKATADSCRKLGNKVRDEQK